MFKFSLLLLSSAVLTGCMTSSQQASIAPTEMVFDYRLRHPIMVSSTRAYLPHQCGQWPHDLGTSPESMKNKTDYNFACATQQNLAAMISNPNDLITPRTEGEIDARRRQQIITRLREGQDTTTPWRVDDRNRVSTRTGG